MPDCEDMGIVKIGMLAAMENALEIRSRRGRPQTEEAPALGRRARDQPIADPRLIAYQDLTSKFLAQVVGIHS